MSESKVRFIEEAKLIYLQLLSCTIPEGPLQINEDIEIIAKALAEKDALLLAERTRLEEKLAERDKTIADLECADPKCNPLRAKIDSLEEELAQKEQELSSRSLGKCRKCHREYYIDVSRVGECPGCYVDTVKVQVYDKTLGKIKEQEKKIREQEATIGGLRSSLERLKEAGQFHCKQVCTDDWTKRGRHAPECWYDDYEDVFTVLSPSSKEDASPAPPTEKEESK